MKDPIVLPTVLILLANRGSPILYSVPLRLVVTMGNFVLQTLGNMLTDILLIIPPGLLPTTTFPIPGKVPSLVVATLRGQTLSHIFNV